MVVIKNTNPFPVNFDHVLYRAKNDVMNGVFDNNSIKNIDPGFDSVDVSHQYYDFRLKDNSPAIDTGVPTAFAFDLDDRVRDTTPDLGCYER